MVMPDSRFRAPLLMLIMLWPIMAQPPIPPRNPVTRLAVPCAKLSRLGRPRVSVMVSMKLSVSRLSMRPTDAITSE